METGEKLQRLGEEIQSSDLGMLRCIFEIYLLFDGRRDRGVGERENLKLTSC